METRHEKQNDLIGFIDTIDSILEVGVDHEDGNQISERIGQLTAVLSTSSFAVALAERIYNEALGKTLKSIFPGTSATDKKLILTGNLSSEKYYLTLAERQNAALVHAIDGLRSMLSYIKEEAKMNSQYNPNPRQ